MEIRDAYDLRHAHIMTHPDSHYFDKDTLDFFGERMSEMYVLKKKEVIKDFAGNHIPVMC